VAIDVVILIVGLLVLAVAGDQFVVGAARVARAMSIRPAIVGAIIGGLGASLPELAVSGVASIRGSTQIAVGNLVGSIAANVALALALAAMVAPIRVESRTIRREAPASVASVALFALLLRGGLSVADGAILAAGVLVAVAFLLSAARGGGRGDRELDVEVGEFFPRPHGRTGREIVRTVAGLAGMIAGAEALVASASDIATRVGVSQEFIGLSVVAVGTSAPLVAIAVQAARRGDHDIAIGSVVGSNLFIALAGGGLVGFVSGGSTSAGTLAPVLMVSLALASWIFMARGSIVTRWEAGALLVVYAAALPFFPR
jgi:cation:H+ antiporter